ncbi:type II toxin-antitoxin system HipA family toxin [Pseudomonas sp. FW300-N1A1]|uniref:type II toxin-antitoxin system HipA family toxin n=1 Tax=Pseudomonas sp. FW300-N1A1 TaxID=2075555 RepID=UPI000CCFFAEA|nr:type II toxin-antitoxin system HipA family toxin [Pseudomonas sp. FW300-N1A1]POA22384.1 type II toxin-antitoxin system HipA family toxin [Pseudomonas sp. FW300-N1A1]
MSRAYIYMEHPETGEVLTLGRLSISNGHGEFVYDPEYVATQGWVPDHIRYPLRTQPFTSITKNRGVPGFINDAMPDGWGERVLQDLHRGDLGPIDYLLKSPNNDRAGNLMAGLTRHPPAAVGQEALPTLKGLAPFIEATQAIFDNQLDDETIRTLKLRKQRSSLGGARPKRTLQDQGELILVKPRDRYDVCDVPALEHACMTFASLKGLNVARTALYAGTPSTLLVKRFDRLPPADTGRRVPMLSALTLLDAEWVTNDHSAWVYAGLANEMKRRGVPDQDLRELFIRMCFNALVGNDDDHPKNHAILWLGGRWRLAPMYDVVPGLDGSSPPYLSMAVGRLGRVISRENMLSHCTHFALTRQQAADCLDEVISWETDLRQHYAGLLEGVELELALAAIGSNRMRVVSV